MYHVKMTTIYQIDIKEQIDHSWAEWFDDFEIIHLESGQTRLKGTVPDQAALNGLLTRIYSLGLTLIALQACPTILGDQK